MLRIFTFVKNPTASAGFEPATLVARGHEIRRKLMGLKIRKWKITQCWVKAHAGIRGNELADIRAKKAATNKTIPDSYNKIPKRVVIKDFEDESTKKWQRNWTQTLKGKTTKEYFPDVEERLKMKLRLTQNLTAPVSGHGKTRDYRYCFNIIDEPTCPFGEGDQTTEHEIYGCERLSKERDRLKIVARRTKPMAN
jgi:hypothetical protein